MIVFAIVFPVFSALAQQPASLPEPAKAVTTPLATPVPVKAVTAGPSASEEVQSATGKPSEPSAKEPEKSVPHIALLVPLASKTLDKVAEALKMGFVAGAEADGKNAWPYRIYTAEDEGASLATQYRKAIADGAAAIIGGVTRDGATAVARESRLLPTLALNSPVFSNDKELPDQFYFISLGLDLEARLVARLTFDEGLRNVAMLVANNALAKRIQDSFEQEWVRIGGGIATRIYFGSDANDATRVSTAMEKLDEKAGPKADAVFLAADPAAARFIRPYLPTGMPVFATSHTVDPRAEAVVNLDLENVRFLEMPWFVERDHPAVMAYAKPSQLLAVEYERLYALGIDAWRLAQLIVKVGDAHSTPRLDGVTGRITLSGRQFTRALSSVEVRDGKSHLVRPTE